MEEPRMDFPEVAGKTVAELSLHYDPTYGRDALQQFANNKQLSISVICRSEADDYRSLLAGRRTGSADVFATRLQQSQRVLKPIAQ